MRRVLISWTLVAGYVLRSLVVCCLGRSGWTPTSDRQVSTRFVVSDLPMALGRCLLFYATGLSAVLRIRDAKLCFAVLRDRRCALLRNPTTMYRFCRSSFPTTLAVVADLRYRYFWCDCPFGQLWRGPYALPIDGQLGTAWPPPDSFRLSTTADERGSLLTIESPLRWNVVRVILSHRRVSGLSFGG